MSSDPSENPEPVFYVDDIDVFHHDTLTSLTIVLGFASLLQRRAAELPEAQRDRFLPQLEALEHAARDLMRNIERER